MKHRIRRNGCIAWILFVFVTVSLAQTKSLTKTASQPVMQTEFAYAVALGAMACASDVTVTINRDTQRSDGFEILVGKTRHPTTRVATDSGAIRLENKTNGIVWLQMANKSMLFNEKAGKRLANDCRNEAQTAAENALATSTEPTILDAPVEKKP
jgi:hypothetical protein